MDKKFKNKVKEEVYRRIERAIDTLVNDDEKMHDLVMLTNIMGRLKIEQLESLNRYHSLIEQLAFDRGWEECMKELKKEQLL